MLDITMNLWRNVRLKVSKKHLSYDGLDLLELRRKVSEGRDTLQVSSKDITWRGYEVERTWKLIDDYLIPGKRNPGNIISQVKLACVIKIDENERITEPENSFPESRICMVGCVWCKDDMSVNLSMMSTAFLWRRRRRHTSSATWRTILYFIAKNPVWLWGQWQERFGCKLLYFTPSSELELTGFGSNKLRFFIWLLPPPQLLRRHRFKNLAYLFFH